MSPHDDAMTLLHHAWLLNGERHAMRVRCGRSSRPVLAELLRKSDEQPLASMRLRGNRSVPLVDRKRLTRDAHRELNVLLQRLSRNGLQDATRSGGYAHHVESLHRALCIDTDFVAQYALPRCPEPALLQSAGPDLYGRPLWLTPAAGRGLHRLRNAARSDGVALMAVSGYRSADYQARLIHRKLAQGQSLEAILRVSTLPGYSEHHLGTTVDLHDGIGPALEERFETTRAFAWLQANAGRYGFRLSYPKHNPWGIAYEPWHWRYRDALTSA